MRHGLAMLLAVVWLTGGTALADGQTKAPKTKKVAPAKNAAAPAEATKPAVAGAPEPAPAQTPAPASQAASQPAEEAAQKPRSDKLRNCEIYMSPIRVAAPQGAEAQKLADDNARLKKQVTALVQRQDGIVSQAKIEEMLLWERLLLLLARGEQREIMDTVEPYFLDAKDAYFKAVDLATKIAQGSTDAAELKKMKADYVAARLEFGRLYGTVSMIMRTVNSIADSRGVTKSDFVTNDMNSANSVTVLDVTSHTAIAAATGIRKNLKFDPSQHNPTSAITGADSVRPQPFQQDLADLFSEGDPNHDTPSYGVNSMLAANKANQKKANRPLITAVRWLANVYMIMTANKMWTMPEPYRATILQIVGVAYDDMMMDYYLDSIQATVRVVRGVSETGNLSIPNVVNGVEDADAHRIYDLAIQTLNAYDSKAIGDDYLITFARIPYLDAVYAGILEAVSRRATAEAAIGVVKDMQNLRDRMTAAKDSGLGMGKLSYVYPPSRRRQIAQALTVLSAEVGTEEYMSGGALTNWVITHGHQVFIWLQTLVAWAQATGHG